MNRSARQAIEDLFERLAKVEQDTPQRDPEAENFIRDKLKAQPAAPYYMAQTIVVQEQALARWSERNGPRSPLEDPYRGSIVLKDYARR